jgi:hypothetical protein
MVGSSLAGGASLATREKIFMEDSCAKEEERSGSVRDAIWGWSGYRLAAAEEPRDQRQHEEDQEDEEEDAGDIDGARGDPAKPKYGGDDCHDEEYGGPVQHCRLLGLLSGALNLARASNVLLGASTPHRVGMKMIGLRQHRVNSG